MKFGLSLNACYFPGMPNGAVSELMLSEALPAEEPGYHDVWLSGHHFMRFDIDPSERATPVQLASITAQPTAWIEAAGARRLTLFMGLAADPAEVPRSVRLFAEEVAPALQTRFS